MHARDLHALRRDEVSAEPTGQAKADAVIEALEGPDEFGLTQTQKASIHQRFAAELGEKADSIEFAKGFGASSCCQTERVKVRGYRKPLEGFNRQKNYVAEKYLCPHCGAYA